MGEEEEKKLGTFRPIIPDVSGIDMNKVVRTQKSNEPDFIPYNPKGRDVMTRTFQVTGLMWLGGFGGGGVVGIMEGWRGAANPSFKIRMNSVMNSVSKRGSKTGNALAVVACLHTFFSWGLDELNLDRYTGDSTWTTPILAGFATGSFYKCTASPRAALLAGAIGSGISVAYGVGGSFVYNELFRKGGRY
jgi:import inner membrane translocase subunit TIM23